MKNLPAKSELAMLNRSKWWKEAGATKLIDYRNLQTLVETIGWKSVGH